MKGKSIVFIAGGIGLAPVRCVIWNVLDLRSEFKDVTVIYGARSVGDLVYKHELEEWARRDDVKLVATVSIRAAKRRIGKARSGLCRTRSEMPPLRRRTLTPSSAALRS